MASLVLATPIRTDFANKLNDEVDGGYLRIYTGSSPGPNNAATGTLLVEFALPAKASNTVANGILTFGTIASANAGAVGTMGYFRIFKTDGTTAVLDGDVAIASATLNLSALTTAIGGPVNITSFTLTVPAGT